MPQRHMRFRRFGRSLHLSIKSADELQHILQLDKALWVATSAPLNMLGADATLLSLIDIDSDGRITCDDMRTAISWLLQLLQNHQPVTDKKLTLTIADINTSHPDGRTILEAVRRILIRAGRPDEQTVSLDEVRQIKQQVTQTPVSEGGIALPEAADDEKVRQFLKAVLDTVGGTAHPGGKQGVTRQHITGFLQEARSYLDWAAKADLPAPETPTAIMPLAEQTPAAMAAWMAIRDQLEKYYAQSRAAAFDPRVTAQVKPPAAQLEQTDFENSEAIADLLKRSPLTDLRTDGILDLAAPLNPWYRQRLEEFRTKVAEPILERNVSQLSEDDYRRIAAALAPHEAWLESKAGPAVEPLGRDALRMFLRPEYAEAAESLLAESAATAFALDTIRLTEKLILYQAHMIDLANNFVSFPHLYQPASRAMFEMGTLIMDGRRFNFAVRVDSRPQHIELSKTSNMYVMYLEVAANPPYEVAIPVTSGDKGNLAVGKRGIFLDITGREFDARTLQIIENPISLAEAIWAPFQRLGRLLTGKIESMTTEAEKKLDVAGTTAFAQVEGTAPQQAAAAEPAPPQAQRAAISGNLLMGGGIAVAALGSATAFITRTLAGLNWWIILAGLGGAILAVMLPTSIVALVKLRRRDLSAILEGSGWAINARMRLSRTQRLYFTRRPKYPPGSLGTHRLGRWILLALLLGAAVATAILLLQR